MARKGTTPDVPGADTTPEPADAGGSAPTPADAGESARPSPPEREKVRGKPKQTRPADAGESAPAAADAGESTPAPEAAGDATAPEAATPAPKGAGDGEPPSPPEKEKARGKPKRTRRIVALTLVILATLFAIVTLVTGWSHALLLNTDRFVGTVTPILQDPQVTQNIGTVVAARTVVLTDVQSRLKAVLPPRVQLVAAPITDQVQKLLAKGVTAFLNSNAGHKTFEQVLRFAHQHLVDLLRGHTQAVKISGNKVVLDLVPIAVEAVQQLRALLPSAITTRLPPPKVDPNAPVDQQRAQLAAALGKPANTDFGQIVLLQSNQVVTAQRAVRYFDVILWLLVGLTIVFIAAALIVSPRRLRTLLQLGVGAVVAAIITRVAITQLQEAIDNAAKGRPALPVIKASVGTLLGSLQSLILWLLIIGAIIGVIAYLATRPAWLTRLWQKVMSWWHATRPQGAEPRGAASAWIAEHLDPLRVGVLVVGVILLLIFARSLGGAIAIVVVFAALEATVTYLGRPQATA